MKKAQTDSVVLVFLVLAILVSSVGLLVTLKRPGIAQISGEVTGVAKVNVSASIAISLPVSMIDFGNKYPGSSDDTTDDIPLPIKVQNDGSVNVNLSIARYSGSTYLFSGTGGGDNSSSFQFKFDSTSTEPGSFNSGASITTFTNVPGTVGIQNALAQLGYTNSADEAELDLKINIPIDEPTGAKTTTLELLATQS